MKRITVGKMLGESIQTRRKRPRDLPYIVINRILHRVKFKYYLFAILFTPATDFSSVLLKEKKSAVSSVKIQPDKSEFGERKREVIPTQSPQIIASSACVK